MSPEDRELIEWVAQDRIGQVMPEGWQYADSGKAILQRLVVLGVMPHPGEKAYVGSVARTAAGFCREWLSAHASAHGRR